MQSKADSLAIDRVAEAEGMAAKLEEAARLLEETLRSHGPEAYQATLDVIWYDAVGQIGTGLLLLPVAALLCFGSYKCLQLADRKDAELVVLSFISGFAATLALIGAGVHLLDYWTWIAAVDPEMALAKRVVEQTGLLAQ